MYDEESNAMLIDTDVLRFLSVLKRGTCIDIYAEGFTYFTTTEIVDSEPDGEGGVVLTLEATIEDRPAHSNSINDRGRRSSRS